MTYRKALTIDLASGNTTVGTFSSNDLKDDGGAGMTFADISVKNGQLDYAFDHDPGVNPATSVADPTAKFTILPADGVVRIEGYDNLRSLRYLQVGTTDVYVALGA